MKKILFLFLIFLIGFVWSCAPLKRTSCEIEFDRILKLSAENQDRFIRGNLFIHGIYTVFYGSLGNKSQLTFRTPFGNKLFTLKYSPEKICVITPQGENLCGKDLDMYWDYFNLKIPFDIRELLTGQFKISPKDKHYCKDGFLIVEDNGAVLKYNSLKPVEISYKGFKAVYRYNEDKPEKITLYQDGQELLRIYIRELREK